MPRDFKLNRNDSGPQLENTQWWDKKAFKGDKQSFLGEGQKYTAYNKIYNNCKSLF